MILDSDLGKRAWGEAVLFATTILNFVQFNDEVGKTPYEIVTGQRPYLGLVQRFGTRCYFCDRFPEDKLERRAIPGAIVGIDEDGPAYRVLELGTTRIYRIRDVVVPKPPLLHEDENKLPKKPPNLPDGPTSINNDAGAEQPGGAALTKERRSHHRTSQLTMAARILTTGAE